MSYNFSNKIALVTGSSRGIGKAIVDEFLNSGAKVIGISTSPFKIDGLYSHVTADFKDIAKTRNKIKTILDEQPIDILINNAGIYPQFRLDESSLETWDDVFTVNLKSMFFISQLVASQMKKNSGGVIVNAASYAGSHPSIGSGLYAATKAGVISLTKSMAAEWAKHNIRVNCYSPGFILTDMTNPLYEQHGDAMTKSIALKRPGKIAEIAKAISFLCSDDASYISGFNMKIDGGKYIVQNQEKA